MKIGILLPQVCVGGAEQIVLYQASEFLKRGHEVEVIGLAAGGPMCSRFRERGIPVIELGLSRSFKPSFQWYRSMQNARSVLSNYFYQRNFDVVHIHLMGPDIDGLLAARKAAVKVVVHTIHNNYSQFNGKSFFEKSKNLIRKIHWRQYDRLFAVDTEVRDWTIDCRLANPDDILVVLNGIDMNHLEVEETRVEIRKSLGIAEGEFVLLNVASLTEQKNQASLIKAIHEIRSEFPFLRLVVAGGGPLEEELKGLSARLGVEDKVSFLGIRDDVPRLLKAADLFVFPSLWEGLPIALLEAMASGIPVLASDLPVHNRLLNKGQYGALCESTPQTIAGGVSRIIKERKTVNEKAAAARKLVRHDYDAGRMAEKYLMHYEQLMAKKTS